MAHMGVPPERQAVVTRTSGPVAIAMLLIVTSFSASLVVSQFRLRNIEARALTIFQDALPRMEHLSTLRTELRRMGMYVSEYVSAASPRAPSREEIQEVRRRLDVELDAYRGRPTSPEEDAALSEIARGLRQLDASTAGLLQAADPGGRVVSTHWLLETFHVDLERVDEAILGLRQVQVEVVRADSERILDAREASLTLAMALGGASFVVAIIASVLVVLTLRSRARLREAHDRLLLQHANRLATVGQLAAGIAHELGSPLQVVAGRAKMVSTGESAGTDARDAGSVILGQAQRMTTIIRGLLDFARRRPPQRALTDLLEVAGETVRVLGPIARKKAVTLALEAEGPLRADVDRLHIQQALTNLVMNAMQAVSAGGHVTVTAGRQQATPPERAATAPAVFATLGVKDDGPGISPEDQARVFDPFFTTKDVGEGSGLGLAVADGLVKENGGWIDVESEAGRGARFSIFLPCHDGQPREARR